MSNELEDDFAMMQQMRLWDKKLDRLSDEMLIYIQQRAYLILEYRTEKLNKETHGTE